MNSQENKINALELTTEDLDAVSGGMKTSSELIAAFYAGIVKGVLEAGGTVTCHATP